MTISFFCGEDVEVDLELLSLMVFTYTCILSLSQGTTVFGLLGVPWSIFEVYD